MPTKINNALMRLSKRAETQDKKRLVDTFVDNGPLFTLLSREDHQVIYGRRGTGKTHALSYLAEKRQELGDCVVLLDLRTIGSTGGLYGDTTLPISERGTRLLCDALCAFHAGLLDFFINHAEELNLSEAGAILDKLAESITEVRVEGSIQKEQVHEQNIECKQTAETKFKLDTGGVGISDSGENISATAQKNGNKTTEIGTLRHRVHFGAVGNALDKLAKMLGKRRAWLLLDEWSSIPIDLQPFLADLLRRSLFPAANCTVKIAAIEQRSKFMLALEKGDYLGVELGADIAADLNFDDFMVFEHDAIRAKEFFRELLYRHVIALDDQIASEQSDSYKFVSAAFTQNPVFEEFVRAAEGVPRDAINIVTLAAQKALNESISIVHLRSAARDWYQRDKDAAVRSSSGAHKLLHWIIEEVIGHRHARAFLLRTDTSHNLINSLFDSRVLHILKRNIAAHDQPGVRYDAFKLDYGCYVDFISTAKAPQGLLQGINTEGQNIFVDVPPDDYRAIRRAILDLPEFEKTLVA